MNISETIGAFEAKTNFSKLLSRVLEDGTEFIITKHDRPIAYLIPAKKVFSQNEAKQAVSSWLERRKHCRLGKYNLQKLISEGRA